MKWGLLLVLFFFALHTGVGLVLAQTPTSITSCGSYSGNLILSQNISSGGNCITISGNNTTLNGNGKTITAGGDAVYVYNKSNANISNLTTNGDISINGDSADGAHVTNVSAGQISIVDADDVLVTGGTFDSAYLGQEESEMERLTFTNNHVEGNANKLVAIRGSGNVPCPGGHTITGNTFISNNDCGAGCDEPMTLFLWCVANSTISNNVMTATDDAQGIRIRDGSNNNTIENNTVTVAHVEGGVFAALNVTTGNEGVRPEPSGNVFRDNFFHAITGRALRFQGSDGNTFERNVFWGNDDTQTASFEQVPQGDVFRYNTFYNSGSGPAVQIDYYTLSGQAMNFKNNIFATTGVRAVTTLKFSSAYYTGDYNFFSSSNTNTVTTAGTIAQWRTAWNDDLHSTVGSPGFVNAAGGNFHLTSDSAARGVAESGTDAGAFQYNGGTPPPECTENWSCGTWSTCVNSSQSRTCTDVNNCGTTDDRPPLTQSCTVGDTTAPTVSITAPTNAATVSGTVSISATASDNVGVAGVTFYVNGIAIGAEDTVAPYSVQWDTTVHTNGSTKSLTAVARDAANNTTTSSAVSVTIQQTPPPCTESWSCSEWSTCSGALQSRTCSDANNCGTTNTRPPLTQSCSGALEVDVVAPAVVTTLVAS